MKILSVENHPVCTLPFLNAGKGQGGFYVQKLPIQWGVVDRLPAALDAIIATADLQGRETLESSRGGPPRLLGETLPVWLAESFLPDHGLTAGKCGVILAGDFFTVPNLDRRGGSGDVGDVWRAFAAEFLWVAGVAGNHDTFGQSLKPNRRIASNAYFLDDAIATVSGIRIGGVSGIIGNTSRPQRWAVDDYCLEVEALLEQRPDVLVLHDGPNDEALGLRGSSAVRQVFERMPATLCIRGHAHWDPPLATIAGGTQVLNCEGRVIVLRDSSSLNNASTV